MSRESVPRLQRSRMSSKYRLRFLVTPPLARLLRKAGVSWVKIGQLFGRETLLAQARELPKDAGHIVSENELSIVVFTMMSGHNFIAPVEVLLGTALRARGHKVTIVICDQQLPLCETKSAANMSQWDATCAKCYGLGSRLFAEAGFDVLLVSELIGEALQSDSEDDEWKEHTEAALLKHYRVGRVEESPEVEDRRSKLQDAARVSAAAARAVVERGVDRVLMSHGNYATWGPARDVFNGAGIPVLVHADTTKRDSLRLHWRHDSFWHEIGDEFERVRHLALTGEEELRLDSYLASRRNHTADRRRYNLGKEEHRAELAAKLGLEPDKETFVLFSNLMWDAASAQREVAFRDPLDWVLATVDWFAAHPGKQLVIRPHPAEHVVGTNQSVSASVLAARPVLPPNVVVLMSDAAVNSWSLVELADCGLVHTSTVGLELSLEGKPCIVVSRTHYRGRGFTLDASSQAEYFELLASWRTRHDPSEASALARRYAYIFFERYQLPFPFMWTIGPALPVAFVNVDDDWTDHQTLRIICDAVETGMAPLLPSSPS